jgi:ferredoxin--NADP+ reductase
MFKIIEKTLAAKNVNRFVVSAPDIAVKAMPGQFVVLRLNEKGERIPVTIAAADKARGTLTLFVQEVGKTTLEMGKLQAGETIKDIAGPLGKPTHITKYGTVMCIAGGVGAAVMYPVAAAMREAGNEVITILGGRAKEFLVLESELRAVSDAFHVTTDDGTYGRKGLVSDVLTELIETRYANGGIDMVFAIGPVAMMKAVCEITGRHGIKTTVSLNPIMVDGTGMCGSCRVTVGGEMKFACVDGPEFDGLLVDWQELAHRLRFFRKEEIAAVDHMCRLNTDGK